jgi:hypothetical protein
MLAGLAVIVILAASDTLTQHDRPPDFSIHFLGTPDGWCELTVSTQRGGRLQRAVSAFLPNRVNTHLRYFPGEFHGEVIGVPLEGLHAVDENVVYSEETGYRSAQPTDPPGSLLPMTRTFALDSRGRLTFFHAVVRARDTNDVVSHMVWGYPPETAMQEAGR